MKKNMVKKFLIGAAACVVLGSLTGCGSDSKDTKAADSKKVYELKVSTTQAESSVIVQGLQDFAKKVG